MVNISSLLTNFNFNFNFGVVDRYLITISSTYGAKCKWAGTHRWTQKMLFYFINRIASNSTSEKNKKQCPPFTLIALGSYANKININLMAESLSVE